MPASSMSATPDELFAELCKVTANWNRFDDIPDGQRAAVRSIGQKLHAIGGEAVMREAYYHAKAANPFVHLIQSYWHGIGDWRW